ncbi:MAG: N-acetyltransferase [Gammaproteobacteria bacterium]|jgi:ribosomal protein S18 acetylase RimI-like enzyme
MIELPAGYRIADPEDAVALARLVNIAGEGLPFYLWTGMASEGQSPWDVGQERARRESGGFSYRNAIVRDDAGQVAACLVGYALDDGSQPTDHAAIPPMFVPLQALEDRVPGTWYVNVLATFPEFRGKGYGSQLLTIAEALAHDSGARGMSIIVADTNTGARRLYERMGYQEQARRPMVKEHWQHPGQHWVLLVKAI